MGDKLNNGMVRQWVVYWHGGGKIQGPDKGGQPFLGYGSLKEGQSGRNKGRAFVKRGRKKRFNKELG